MVISTITLLNTIYKQTTESTGTLVSALPTVPTSITLESWFSPFSGLHSPGGSYFAALSDYLILHLGLL